MKKFTDEAMTITNKNFNVATSRLFEIYQRENDNRDIFTRDYTRILFSQGYRRLKNKTQVFFSPQNDHICTRGEHVCLVESISITICDELGLNSNLAKSIAIGHDIGHGPFGHGGEKIISELFNKNTSKKFHHEINSLFFLDYIETIQSNEYNFENLNLTYAVRDGIVCHCGELSQRSIKKRNHYEELENYKTPGQYEPFTWEGCVVKISDKIAYLARDIEDALTLKIINETDVLMLVNDINGIDSSIKFTTLNNGALINYFINDICTNSCLDNGISMSESAFKIMNLVMKFNYKKIYLIDRVKIHHNYVHLIIHSIYDKLVDYYDRSINKDLIMYNLEHDKYLYPNLIESFTQWLITYTTISENYRIKHNNKIVFDYKNEEEYKTAVIYFISGMTDSYIKLLFEELISL